MIRACVLLLLSSAASAQTLQRRTEPPPLHQESCREHVAINRHILLDASKVEPLKETAKDMRSLYQALGKTAYIDHVCASRRTRLLFDIDFALARLRLAEHTPVTAKGN